MPNDEKDDVKSDDVEPVTLTISKAQVASIAILAGLLVTLLALLILPTSHFTTSVVTHSEKSLSQRIDAIANEVAKNHIRMKPLDIETQQFSDLQQFFTQLEFVPRPSRHFETQQHNNSHRLVGGRYCSIQSVTAAQLRFGQTDKPLTTLYQTEYLPDVFGELPVLEQGQAPIVTYAKGLRIEIWVEKQLLMVTSQVAVNTNG